VIDELEQRRRTYRAIRAYRLGRRRLRLSLIVITTALVLVVLIAAIRVIVLRWGMP
jgi:hypothetical protein